MRFDPEEHVLDPICPQKRKEGGKIIPLRKKKRGEEEKGENS